MSVAPAPAPKGKARALCIGINYEGSDNALRGCINDAENSLTKFKQMAGDSGWPPVEEMLLTDHTKDTPTRDNIIRALAWLVTNAQPNDLLWFHFSGHGSHVRDRDGDEADGQDECICTLDNKAVTDDELKKFLCGTLPVGCTLYAIFDCCHSGTIIDMHYAFDERTKGFVMDTNNACVNPNVFMLSGCMNVQTSADLPAGYKAGLTQSVGALTEGCLRLMDKRMAWKDFVPILRADLKKSRLTQIPQFETGRKEDPKGVAFARLFPGELAGAPQAAIEPITDPPATNYAVDHIQSGPQGQYTDDSQVFATPLSTLMTSFQSILSTSLTGTISKMMGGGALATMATRGGMNMAMNSKNGKGCCTIM